MTRTLAGDVLLLCAGLVVACDSVCVLIVQSTYIKIDVVPEFVSSVSHSVTLHFNYKIAGISQCVGALMREKFDKDVKKEELIRRVLRT